MCVDVDDQARKKTDARTHISIYGSGRPSTGCTLQLAKPALSRPVILPNRTATAIAITASAADGGAAVRCTRYWRQVFGRGQAVVSRQVLLAIMGAER